MSPRITNCLALFAALAALGAAPALAERGESRVGLQFGGSVPTGDFGRSVKAGFVIGVAGTYMALERAGFGFDAAYHGWSAADSINAISSTIYGLGTSARLDAIQATAHALYDFRTRGRTRPFAKAGLGAYWLKTLLDTTVGTLEARSMLRFGYYAGAGIDFMVGEKRRIGIGGTVQGIQAEAATGNLFTVTLSLSGR